MDTDLKLIDQELDRIAVRLWLIRALRAVVTVLLAASAAVAAAAVMARVFGGWPWLRAVAALGAIALLVCVALAVIRAARRRYTRFNAAAVADEALGLKERLSSLVESRQRPAPGMLHGMLARDAVRAAEDAEFEAVAPVRLPAHARWLVLPAAVLAAVFLVHPDTLETPLIWKLVGWTEDAGGAGGDAPRVDLPADAFPDEDRPDRTPRTDDTRNPARPDVPLTHPPRGLQELLTNKERMRIIEDIKASHLAGMAKAQAADSAASGDSDTALEFVRTRSAATRMVIPPALEARAVWRWKYPAYQEEIERYFSR